MSSVAARDRIRTSTHERCMTAQKECCAAPPGPHERKRATPRFHHKLHRTEPRDAAQTADNQTSEADEQGRTSRSVRRASCVRKAGLGAPAPEGETREKRAEVRGRKTSGRGQTTTAATTTGRRDVVSSKQSDEKEHTIGVGNARLSERSRTPEAGRDSPCERTVRHTRSTNKPAPARPPPSAHHAGCQHSG